MWLKVVPLGCGFLYCLAIFLFVSDFVDEHLVQPSELASQVRDSLLQSLLPLMVLAAERRRSSS
jgi:hypothetical protein